VLIDKGAGEAEMPKHSNHGALWWPRRRAMMAGAKYVATTTASTTKLTIAPRTRGVLRTNE
jgi:hypothetical protein